MRMRKKKHLEERLAQCENLLLMQTEERDIRAANSHKEYIDFPALFGNRNPVFLEIGCGKGRFAAEFARRNPDINVLAIERAANVLVTACEQSADIPNLRFMLGGAEYLPRYVEEGSVGRIFLNFSCPFPKKSYAPHRLTHSRFLEIYKPLLAEDAEIHQKTDNMHFFEFSLEQFASCGFALKNISLDLHNSGYDGNIMTEYEELFSSQGNPIYRLEAYLQK